MSPTTCIACAWRKLLEKAALDAINQSSLAKQLYDSTKQAEREAIRVLDDHIAQHG